MEVGGAGLSISVATSISVANTTIVVGKRPFVSETVIDSSISLLDSLSPVFVGQCTSVHCMCDGCISEQVMANALVPHHQVAGNYGLITTTASITILFELFPTHYCMCHLYISPQAVGDGGQGWGNAILYIFLSPMVRERLIIEWCGSCAKDKNSRVDRAIVQQPLNHSSSSDGLDRPKGRGETQRKKFFPDMMMKDGSDESLPESLPLIKGRAIGYHIRKYDPTTSIAGSVVETGSSVAT